MDCYPKSVANDIEQMKQLARRLALDQTDCNQSQPGGPSRATVLINIERVRSRCSETASRD